jgi:ADP-ribose pyrophosphatase YjhB (NUDIX family)
MNGTLDEAEVAALAQRYGEPLRLVLELEIGEDLFLTRFVRSDDRRGEVVLALELASGKLLLHRKEHYDPPSFRLLSGGVNHDEPVLRALHREIGEETGLQVEVQRFLAVIEYTMHYGEIEVPFVSYVFHVSELAGQLTPDYGEIAELRAVDPVELSAVADQLRSIGGERGYWGRWRAIAHDVVADYWAQLARRR